MNKQTKKSIGDQQAFPFPSGLEPRMGEFHDRAEGMTYRQWLAGQSISAILINNPHASDWTALAKDAMSAANALIIELDKQ